jgi:hypothetical protein
MRYTRQLPLCSRVRTRQPSPAVCVLIGDVNIARHTSYEGSSVSRRWRVGSALARFYTTDARRLTGRRWWSRPITGGHRRVGTRQPPHGAGGRSVGRSVGRAGAEPHRWSAAAAARIDGIAERTPAVGMTPFPVVRSVIIPGKQ